MGKNLNAPAEVGGLYGINVETLGAGKTLTPGTDEIYQYLDEGGANRIITLATVGATAGDRFVIRHNGAFNDPNHLEVKQGANTLDKIYAGAIKGFIFDGTNWIPFTTGTGEVDTDGKIYSVAIGREANAYDYAVAVGFGADAHTDGVAVGESALGYTSGVGVGRDADGHGGGVAVGKDAVGHTSGVAIGASAVGSSEGVAIGASANGSGYSVAVGQSANGSGFGVAVGYRANTNSNRWSIALGYFSECERVAETSININGVDEDQENNVVQGRWEGELAGGAGATEIFCGGFVNARFTIRPNSVLAFRMIITARDNVTGEVAMYTVDDGLVKKAGAGTAVVLAATTTVVVVKEEDAAWDCVVAVDGGGNNLIITVTGDGTNITQWAAVMNGVETHF